MNSAQRELLLRHLHCPCRVDEPLASLTTFRIGGPAAILAEPRSRDELIQAYRILRAEQASFFHLGHGSNLLVSDEGIDGVVVRTQGDLENLSMINDSTIMAGPGGRLLDLTAFAAHHGLSGMEQLSGIPGSVGGGVFMNAGAYGGEIADTLISVDTLLPSGDVQTLNHDEIGFGYRQASALQKVIILESRFRLKPGDRRSIFAEMRRVWKLRRTKQPLEWPSAGSIFKRPAGDYAGRLIEAVNGKGFRIGGAMVSEKHAGIFVNVGGATAADVAALVREIRRRVYDKFHILLEPEVKTVGFKEDPFDLSL
jgi:UDP-N-acetylmuramate dehydrogenase